MIRTIVSVILSFAFIFGLSFYEIYYVESTFSHFHSILEALHQKTEDKVATYEDGTAVQSLWEEQKRTLHVWIPHTAILEVDYQLYDAVGCLYVKDYKSAIPKLEVLMGMCENIPSSYSLRLENIL